MEAETTMTDARELALEHWDFIENLLKKVMAIYSTDGDDENYWLFLKTLYVEAMIHGVKHGEEGLDSGSAVKETEEKP
jgi:hypothetical protein